MRDYTSGKKQTLEKVAAPSPRADGNDLRWPVTWKTIALKGGAHMKSCRSFFGIVARFAVPVGVWIAFAPSHAAVAQVGSSASSSKDTGHARIAFSHALPRLDVPT